MGYLKKKRAPVSSGDASIDRIVDTIYKDINEIINSLNRYIDVEIRQEEGETGDIRITESKSTVDGKSTITYHLEFKTKEGWARIAGTLV